MFQHQLTEALPVPVFTSSLLQVPMACALIRRDQAVGILTARTPALTEAHLAAVGIQNHPIVIAGMENAPEFSAVFMGGRSYLDERLCREEMRSAAEALMRHHTNIGAIVLECTNMPPYADTVRETTGVPVFDAVTLVNYAHQVVGVAGRPRRGR